MGRARREARRARAHAEFAAYPEPPTPGWWPCLRDAGQFRRHDGVGWTDGTCPPAQQPSDYEAGPTDPTPNELRSVPEWSFYRPAMHGLERGWHGDPAAPDLLQRRFNTGTEWSELIAIPLGPSRTPIYRHSTLDESRRHNAERLEEVAQEPTVTLEPAAAAGVVLVTAAACSVLIAAPALPPGAGSRVAHSIGVILGLAVLTFLCIAAADATRRSPAGRRSYLLRVEYGLALVGFVVARGFRSVLAALGLG